MHIEYQGEKCYFYDYNETFDFFYQNKNISFLRLGDGEFRIITGCKIYYQKNTEELKNRMTEILNDCKESEKENYKICIPNFNKEFLNERLFKNLDLSRKYYNSKFSLLIKEKKKIKEFWENQNICFVGAYSLYNKKPIDYNKINGFIKELKIPNHKKLVEKYKEISTLEHEFNHYIVEFIKDVGIDSDEDISFLKNIIDYDYIYHFLKSKNYHPKFLEILKSSTKEEILDKIFDNVKDIIKIRTTFNDSWNHFEEYKKQCLQIPKDYKFVISCGPTGKILGYDLIKNGYIVYDLGHFHKIF